MSQELLRISHLAIRIGQAAFLTDLSFSIHEGEILGFSGLSPEQRELLISYMDGKLLCSSGQLFAFGTPRKAMEAVEKIFCLHAESSLVESMTITENLFLFSGKKESWPLLIHRKSLNELCQELLDRYGLALSADTIVRDLSQFGHIAVEILSAVVRDAKIIFYNRSLDELSQYTFSQLCTLLRSIADSGIAVALLCGQPTRMLQLCSRICVIKNGVYIKTFTAASTTVSNISSAIWGTVEEPDSGKQSTFKKKPLLSTRALRLQEKDSPLDLEIFSGEIVCLTGYVSTDADNILRAIYGFLPCSCQHLSVCGTIIPTIRPDLAHMKGMLLVQSIGSMRELLPYSSVRTNIMLPLVQRSAAFGGRIRRQFLELEVQRAAEIVGLTADQLSLPISPKLLLRTHLARILLSHRPVLLLENPFSGLDPSDDYLLKHFLIDYGKAGNCVLFSSTYFPELAAEHYKCCQIDKGQLEKNNVLYNK